MKKKILLWYVILAAMLVIPLAVFIQGTKADSATLPWEQRLENQINIVRLNHGLDPVDHDRRTDQWAESWVRKIPNNWAHSNMYRLMDYANANMAGEVMANGPLPFTPRETVRAWMHSPGHRAILLTRAYEYVGVGSIRANGRRWVVVDVIRR